MTKQNNKRSIKLRSKGSVDLNSNSQSTSKLDDAAKNTQDKNIHTSESEQKSELLQTDEGDYATQETSKPQSTGNPTQVSEDTSVTSNVVSNNRNNNHNSNATNLRNSDNRKSKNRSKKKRSNRGCWIAGGIGCGVTILVIGAIFALLVLLASAGGGSTSSSLEEVIEEGNSESKIAVISVNGMIMHAEGESLFAAAGTTPDSISDKLDKALKDNKVKGILIKVNSPGGEVVASDLIYREISEASEKKPVVVWMSSLGASGGYLVASPADKIVAHPNCITGSIGTILEVSNMDELNDKLGIKTRTFKSGQFKDDEYLFEEGNDSNEDSSSENAKNNASKEEEAAAIYQGLVDESYEDFVEAVAKGREMDVEEVRELADGRVYSGYQAYNNGLVDEVGDMDVAVNELEELAGEENMELIEYTMPASFFSGFSSYKTDLLKRIGLEKDTTYQIGLYYLLES
jgi:protease-4